MCVCACVRLCVCVVLTHARPFAHLEHAAVIESFEWGDFMSSKEGATLLVMLVLAFPLFLGERIFTIRWSVVIRYGGYELLTHGNSESCIPYPYH